MCDWPWILDSWPWKLKVRNCSCQDQRQLFVLLTLKYPNTPNSYDQHQIILSKRSPGKHFINSEKCLVLVFWSAEEEAMPRWIMDKPIECNQIQGWCISAKRLFPQIDLFFWISTLTCLLFTFDKGSNMQIQNAYIINRFVT